MKSCGNCNICCTFLDVEIDGEFFPRGVPCKHLDPDSNGCKIYERRPDVCRNYHCVYTQNIIPELKKPSDNGLLISIVQNQHTTNHYFQVVAPKSLDGNQFKIVSEFCKQNNIHLEFKDLDIFINPDLIQLSKIVNMLHVLDKTDIAKKVIQAFDVNTENPVVNRIIAQCYDVIGDHLNAISSLHKCILYENNDEQIIRDRYNIATMCITHNYPEESYRQINIIENSPTFKTNKIDDIRGEFFVCKSTTLSYLNRREEAIKITKEYINTLRNAISEKSYKKIQYNLLSYNLYEGNFAKNVCYLGRLAKETSEVERFDLKRNNILGEFKNNFQLWNGEIEKNKKLIVIQDCGIGDEIIYSRFFKQIKETGMIPYLIGDDRNGIYTVLNRNGFNCKTEIGQIVGSTESAFYCYLTDIPYNLNLDLHDFWNGPYIKPCKENVDKFKKLIPNNNKLKIGLRWKSGTDYGLKNVRDISLTDLYNNINDINADFYSLQFDDNEDHLNFPGIIPSHKEINDWEDTFGLLSNLDIVITTCTSVAHASLSMGIPTFVFSPISSYYIWDRHEVWYGKNVKLLKQSKVRSWEEQYKQLHDILKTYE
jgi:Fe-S-cluster containining protein